VGTVAGVSSSLVIFGDHEPDTVEQLERCVSAVEGSRGVLCADGHLGYSQPIGGVVAYPDHVSPSGVGYDIGCGNKAVMTNLKRADVADHVPGLVDEIVERISFGMGRSNKEPVADAPVLDGIREADFPPQRELLDLAAKQLGTVGAGNHYVDLFADEHDQVWIGVHFGSRGFGHKTASGFLALAQGRGFTEHAIEGEMRSPPVLLDTRTELGQAYISAMTLAGEYAYAGRDWVCSKVLEILGAESRYEVHNHHNFAWREWHDGSSFWVVRKGATPALPGQRGFVGSTMGDESVILEGVESDGARDALYSTVHGAGRVMSRTEAAGKMRRVWECTERDCDFYVTTGEYRVALENRGALQHDRFTMCPDHPHGRMRKQRRRVRDGKVDWAKVRAEIRGAGIELRGGAADEAPEVYKDLREVLAAHGDTIRVVHRLRPLAVAMAGADVFDPFKD
jgi:tRNA-splicing ligase RtcB